MNSLYAVNLHQLYRNRCKLSCFMPVDGHNFGFTKCRCSKLRTADRLRSCRVNLTSRRTSLLIDETCKCLNLLAVTMTRKNNQTASSNRLWMMVLSSAASIDVLGLRS